jgi:hypothetical protein
LSRGLFAFYLIAVLTGIWIGALFVISVYAFPGGIVGRLRQAMIKAPRET